MHPRRIELDYTPTRFAALDAVQFGRVFLSPPGPHFGNPSGRRRKWSSTTHDLTHPMKKALDEMLAKGGIDVTKGVGVSVSLTKAALALLTGEWDDEARRRGLHPNQQDLPSSD